MKVSDYIFERLKAWGAGHVFLVTGGGAMHLNDSFAAEPRLPFTCTHHEQACGHGCRVLRPHHRKAGVINVTTGPGGINALNGVFGAWTDSVPMLIVSGQVKRETCMATYGLPDLRQLGDQEVDIVRMVRGHHQISPCWSAIPRSSAIIWNAPGIWRRPGRPGPCWLDIPVDVQSAQIDPSNCEPTTRGRCPLLDAVDPAQLPEVREARGAAKRPVIFAGSGVRHGGCARLSSSEVVARARHSRRHGVDARPHRHRRSTILRPAREPSENARATSPCRTPISLLVLGSRLNIRQVSYNWKSFARHAVKIQVDVDEAELHKPTAATGRAHPLRR